MKDNKVGKALEDIAEHISLSKLAKSVGKDKSWLYHKMRNDIVNGVQYRFSATECALLAEQLKSLADNIRQCADTIEGVVVEENRSAGKYFTQTNVFEYTFFKQWFESIPNLDNTTILEQYRDSTKDIFLNSFKGLRSDGMYRKRIPFKVIRSILTYALRQK